LPDTDVRHTLEHLIIPSPTLIQFLITLLLLT
jgi:hypothetical protein